MKILIDRLGLEETDFRHTSRVTLFGPVYRITKDLAGNPLPEVVRKSKETMTPFSKTLALWDNIHLARLGLPYREP